MSRAVLLDVDGVLVHGYHARPERQIRWDENLPDDLGVDPLRFKQEFVFAVFVEKVIVGEISPAARDDCTGHPWIAERLVKFIA